MLQEGNLQKGNLQKGKMHRNSSFLQQHMAEIHPFII